MSATIEELKYSIIDSNVPLQDDWDAREKFQFRKNHLTITQCIWITKRPVIDCGFTLYNPKSLILIILN